MLKIALTKYTRLKVTHQHNCSYLPNRPFANLKLFSNRIKSLSYLRHSSFNHSSIFFLPFIFMAVTQTFSVFNYAILRNKVLWNFSVLHLVKKSLKSASQNRQFDNLDEKLNTEAAQPKQTTTSSVQRILRLSTHVFQLQNTPDALFCTYHVNTQKYALNEIPCSHGLQVIRTTSTRLGDRIVLASLVLTSKRTSAK